MHPVPMQPTPTGPTPPGPGPMGQAALQPVPVLPVAALVNLRRSLIVAVCLGLAALLGTALFGRPLAGIFACIGLALGALNTRMVQRSVLRFASNDAPNKKSRFTQSVLARLALVTLLAVGCALLVRPDGLGVFTGLAAFQLVMLLAASIPIFKSLRQPS